MNITVSNIPRSNDFTLLNYLTSPDVTILSACLASTAIPGVFAPAKLFFRDTDGHVKNYHPKFQSVKY